MLDFEQRRVYPIFGKDVNFILMFNGPDYPQSLDESLFDAWLEKGRESRIPYAYLLVIWDELDTKYMPVYTEKRSDIHEFARYGQSPENQLLVAAYDLYSESRVL